MTTLVKFPKTMKQCAAWAAREGYSIETCAKVFACGMLEAAMIRRLADQRPGTL